MANIKRNIVFILLVFAVSCDKHGPLRFYKIPAVTYCEDTSRGCWELYAVENFNPENTLQIDSVDIFVNRMYSRVNAKKFNCYSISIYKYDSDEYEEMQQDTFLLAKRSTEMKELFAYEWRSGIFDGFRRQVTKEGKWIKHQVAVIKNNK